MFILATTELHKVPATIKSRCQQFSFKRILPDQIAKRLAYVAEQEGIDLTGKGAALLARLADGGLRDALSLLDQCAGGRQTVDEQEILDTLGLAGNLETGHLMDQIARRDTAAALETLARLYGNGKDVGSVLGELSALARDLLLRKTAPKGGAALLTRGNDEGTMAVLEKQYTAPRLLQVLTQLQATSADLPRSSSRRTDAELCLIRLCDEGLDESFAGLSARIARLEERVSRGIPAAQPTPASPAPTEAEPVAPRPAPQPTQADTPPWEEERPPLPEEPPESPEPVYDLPESAPANDPKPAAKTAAPPAPAAGPDRTGGDQSFWPSFLAGLRDPAILPVFPYLNNANKVTGVWKNGSLTLWTDTEFTRSMLNKPAVLHALTQAAQASFGGSPAVSVVTGKAPPQEAQPEPMSAAPAPAQTAEQKQALDQLLAMGEQFDNIVIH